MSLSLSEKQKLAAVMLLSGFKASEAAVRLRCAPKTISRWRSLPRFKTYVEDLKAQNRESLRNRIFFLVEDTVAALSNAIRYEFRPEKQAKMAVDILKLLAQTNVMSYASADGSAALSPRAVPPAGQEFISPEMPGVGDNNHWLVPIGEAQGAFDKAFTPAPGDIRRTSGD